MMVNKELIHLAMWGGASHELNIMFAVEIMKYIVMKKRFIPFSVHIIR